MTRSSASTARKTGANIASRTALHRAGHVAIQGNGFFIVRNPASDDLYATRSGRFHLDEDGYLVTDRGARVQGRVDGSFASVGDIQINTGGLAQIPTPATMVFFSIDSWGRIIVYLSDSTSFLRGQILLQNFRDLEALVDEGNELYSNLPAAGPLPAMSAPGTHGLGTIESGIPELSRLKQIQQLN